MTPLEFAGLLVAAVAVFGSIVAIVFVGAVTASVLLAATLPASVFALLGDLSRWLVANDGEG